MESLQKAHSLFLADLYTEAEPLYEQASNTSETAAEALTSLAYVYIKQGNLLQAISKADQAIHIDPSNYLPYLRKAQALFYNQNFAAASEIFTYVNTLRPETATAWIQKCESELKTFVTKEVYTWFQSNEDIHLIFFVKTKNPESVSLNIASDTVSIKAQTINDTEFLYDVKLSKNILPDQSNYQVKSNKVEIVLKKAEIVNWHSLEPLKITESKPAYPSSSKKHVDWNKLDKDIEQELKKEKPEGEAALNELFKQIYENADEDTRRAMIKSYQTSGGTVLSTNWGEVKEKDYEGKDRPDPPKGQEWAKNN
jgi:suppressor of G2 allele of SKP1